ncbi:hypothetical protein O6H91_Y017400 [Diphasiastrum complanatum]|nr:hypothetical protein O6H91_Y017400 [Diphasiastrum complanatum]
MAPGKKKASKSKSKGIGVDFRKVKHKVGRKLPPAQNVTKVEFKSKAIVLPGQSLLQNKDGCAVNQRRQTLKELLGQTTHYSERVRKGACLGFDQKKLFYSISCKNVSVKLLCFLKFKIQSEDLYSLGLIAFSKAQF